MALQRFLFFSLICSKFLRSLNWVMLFPFKVLWELWIVIHYPVLRGSGDSNTHSCVTRDHTLINSIIHLWTNYHICTEQVHPTSNYNFKFHLNKLSSKKSPVHPVSILQGEAKMFKCAWQLPSLAPSIAWAGFCPHLCRKGLTCLYSGNASHFFQTIPSFQTSPSLHDSE